MNSKTDQTFSKLEERDINNNKKKKRKKEEITQNSTFKTCKAISNDLASIYNWSLRRKGLRE